MKPDWSTASDGALGQMWADTFVWYLMEVVEQKVLLSDEHRQRMYLKLKEIDAELQKRGLPARSDYAEAFRTGELLPEEDLKRMIILAYGRDVRRKRTTQ